MSSNVRINYLMCGDRKFETAGTVTVDFRPNKRWIADPVRCIAKRAVEGVVINRGSWHSCALAAIT
jgi:hypothetical protein